MSTVAEHFGCGLYMSELSDPTLPLFVGLECEIESIRSAGEGFHPFKVTTDGSLRNHGQEFISKPIPVSTAVESFTQLHRSIEIRNPEQKFSQRTSIHVHANCANLDTLETRNVIYMYALFEEYFFLLVDADRRHNIHCVPLTETYLPMFYQNDLSLLVDRWHKYTALNIKPLSTQGTIEFRHMQGHDDSECLSQWLGSINGLIAVGKHNPINKDSLTANNMAVWFREIFGNTKLAHMVNTIPTIAFNQILDLKLAVI